MVWLIPIFAPRNRTLGCIQTHAVGAERLRTVRRHPSAYRSSAPEFHPGPPDL